MTLEQLKSPAHKRCVRSLAPVNRNTRFLHVVLQLPKCTQPSAQPSTSNRRSSACRALTAVGGAVVRV
jgi:hypothetical protein